MSMTPYEIVRRAVEFDRPERLPILQPQDGVCDAHFTSWRQPVPSASAGPEHVDEWGCRWVRTEYDNMGQVKGFPLADWSAWDTYQWPDPNDPKFYEGMEQQFEHSEDKYVITGYFMLLFERMHSLHGFENVMMDLYAEPEKLGALADRIVEFVLGVMANVSQRFPGQIHGFRFTDDWGTERDVFIRPELWKEFFQPRYKRLFDFAHEQGWHVWMHTCGKVNGIIEGLIEAGLDVINLMQPRCLGIEEIGQRFSGRICFETHPDAQVTLPDGDPVAIREEVDLLVKHWATPEGGLVYGIYGHGEGIGAPDNIADICLQAFRDADPYIQRT